MAFNVEMKKSILSFKNHFSRNFSKKIIFIIMLILKSVNCSDVWLSKWDIYDFEPFYFQIMLAKYCLNIGNYSIGN